MLLFFVILLVWHVPVFVANDWSFKEELRLLVWLGAWMIAYDWAWFLFHPMRNAQRTLSGEMFAGAWWHPHRLQRGPLAGYPADYPRAALGLAVMTIILGVLDPALAIRTVATITAGTLWIIFVWGFVGDHYHNWYYHAHKPENDGRSEYIPPTE